MDVAAASRACAVRELEREPLRNVVLLKQLAAFADSAAVHRVSGDGGAAVLVLLDTAASSYDRATYPEAAWACLVSSDHPGLTARLMDHVPTGAGVVFKLANDADRAAVAARFPIVPRTRFLSYTARDGTIFGRDAAVAVTDDPGDAAFEMFEAQGHARSWLRPLLAAGQAVACVLRGDDGDPAAVCLAFRSHGAVWEVGGVFTAPHLRGRRLAGRAVGTALAVLRERGLLSRYQVQADNRPSIALAERLGLQRFLTLTHYLHVPTAASAAPTG